MKIGQEVYVIRTVGDNKYAVSRYRIVSFDNEIACVARSSGIVDFAPVEGLLETDAKLAAVIKQLEEQGRTKF